jgi:hypothetical protein
MYGARLMHCQKKKADWYHDTPLGQGLKCT